MAPPILSTSVSSTSVYLLMKVTAYYIVPGNITRSQDSRPVLAQKLFNRKNSEPRYRAILCEHALLPMFLLGNNICITAIAGSLVSILQTPVDTRSRIFQSRGMVCFHNVACNNEFVTAEYTGLECARFEGSNARKRYATFMGDLL